MPTIRLGRPAIQTQPPKPLEALISNPKRVIFVFGLPALFTPLGLD